MAGKGQLRTLKVTFILAVGAASSRGQRLERSEVMAGCRPESGLELLCVKRAVAKPCVVRREV